MIEGWVFGETKQDENGELKESVILEIERKTKEIGKTAEVSSQETAESTYNRTIQHITKEFGSIMPESQLVRIDIESEQYKPKVLSSEVYFTRFPEVDPSVLGHCDSEGRVFLRDGSPETISHVTTHEALHLTSYRELDDIDRNRIVYRSGIREVINNSGIVEDKNQALNEGITEMYAIREMQLWGDMKSIEAVSAYPEARQKAYELQGIVGSDVIQQAYFGGKGKFLKAEVNRLSYGDETAWDRYSKNVDVLEYGTDIDKIREARRRLTIQHAIMLSFLEEEKMSL